MLNRLALVASLVAFSVPAFAQQAPAPQKFFTFALTIDETNLVINKLAGSGTWVEMNPVMQKIIAQINEQSKPPAPAKAEPKPEDHPVLPPKASEKPVEAPSAPPATTAPASPATPVPDAPKPGDAAIPPAPPADAPK